MNEQSSDSGNPTVQSRSDKAGMCFAGTRNQGGWRRKLPVWGVFDDGSEEPGFGRVLWNAEADKKFKCKPDIGAETGLDILLISKDKYADRAAVGWRELIQTHMVPDEKGVPREKLELANTYVWMSYRQYYTRVEGMAKGLAAVGVGQGTKVVIYAETQRDWMISGFAAWYLNAQVVTIYATLGEEGAVYGINEVEAHTVVADAKLVKILLKVLPKLSTVKNVVSMTLLQNEINNQIVGAGLSCNSIDGLIDLGSAGGDVAGPARPKKEDVCVIMYTSGTTGAPKGVVITHGSIPSVIAGVEHFLKGAVNTEDVYCAYLPLAHVMEMGAEICFLAMGCKLGFGNPHTLLSKGDSSKKLFLDKSQGDATVLKPTMMVFPPAVLDKIYQVARAQAAELKGMSKKVFEKAMASGESRFARGEIGTGRFYNHIAFKKKFQALVGGHLRLILSGSAPLSADVQQFIQITMDVPVRQGYGLTETLAASCIAFWGDNSANSVGPPSVSTCIRLADWPEGNYLNSDISRPEVGMPRGEVLIGGHGLAQGYYINPNSPNEEFQKKNEEDWITIQGIRFFRSGDIGQIRPDGVLQIIDRKKDLWKGPNGEYVALTKVEAALTLCEYVAISMCYGRTGGDFPVALICPQKPKIKKLAQELNVGGSHEELCADLQIVTKVAEACKAACKGQKLAEFETPKQYALCAELWTPENEMLTAAMKLKRPIIVEACKAQIDQMYSFNLYA